MGNYCKGENNLPREVIQFPQPPVASSQLYVKSPAQSIRMGDIIRSKSSNAYVPNSYNFNLSVKESYEPINVVLSVVSNYSEALSLKVPVLGNMDTVRMDVRNAPIIDHSDPHSDTQILHKLTIRNQSSSESHYTVKIYPFVNYQDNLFKCGIYEASLYNTLNEYNRSASYLQDLFTIEKGEPKALVFLFNSYLYSLEDILVYRRLANMPYSNLEQLYIAEQILGKYILLSRNSIVHRDVRPGKIYLADSANPTFKGYEFQNLESARKITQRDAMLANANNNREMLMTTRGVPLYCSAHLAGFHERQESMAIYDPWLNDRIGLAKTLSMLATFDLDTPEVNLPLIKQKNKPLHDLIVKLQNPTISLDEVSRSFTLKSQQRSTTILDSDYNICHNLLPRLLRQANKQRIENATTQALFALHLQDHIATRMDKMISQNYRDGVLVNNVAVLDRLGRHYEGVGLRANDYYDEEVSLLMDLAQDHRMRGYPTDTFLAQAQQIYGDKFGGKLKNPITNANYKIENAYLALSKQDLQSASTLINNALLQSSQSTQIPITTQLNLIQAKGVIETCLNGPDAGSTFFERGLELSSQRGNFPTQVEMLDHRSNFQHLLGQNLVAKLGRGRGMMSPDDLARGSAQCESVLTAARDTKMEIPLKNPLPLAHIYESLGDLAVVREDYQGASSIYDKAFRLMASSQVPISEAEKIRILEKMHSHYSQHSQNFSEQQKIKLHLNDLKKQSQVKSERDDRKYFKTIRYKKEQLKGKIFPERSNQIREVDQIYEEDTSKKVQPVLQSIPSREVSQHGEGSMISHHQ